MTEENAVSEDVLVEEVRELRSAVYAWRERSPQDRVAAVCGWAKTWSCIAADHPDVIAMAHEAGLHPNTLVWGLRTTAQAVVDDAGEVLARTPIGRDRRASMVYRIPEVCGHVWASTLPCSGWFPVLGALLIGSAALLKAPRGVSIAAEIFTRSLADFDPLLGACVRTLSWSRGSALDAALVRTCDALFVSGGRGAIQRFGQLVWERHHAIPYLPFGPGISVALIPHDVDADEDLFDQLALDIAAYDQRGCLSPRALWVDAAHPSLDEIPQQIADALSRRALTMPRGDVSMQSAAKIAQRLATTEFLGVAYPTRDGLVLYEPEPFTASNPLQRTLAVHTFQGGSQGLRNALDRWLPHEMIHSAACAGPMDRRRHFAKLFAARGASRVCAFGQLQKPPMTWYHDGLNWLDMLIFRSNF